jgi:multidrug resistance efflux pump
VLKVHVAVSDHVKEGDALFELDDRELRAQLLGSEAQVEVAKANLMVAEAQLVKARDSLARLQAVPDPRAISQDDLKNRANEVLVTEAQVTAARAASAAAQADVERTKLLMDRLVVRAPREGTILQSNIRPGEYASPSGKTAPMVLGDLGKLQVRADVDEQNAPLIRVGQSGEAFLKGDSKTPIPLHFVRIEPFVIPKVSLTGASTERVDTRVLQVIFSIDRMPEGMPLYVGQQVDVFIRTADGVEGSGKQAP